MFILRHQHSDSISYYSKSPCYTQLQLLQIYIFLDINKGDIKDTEMGSIMNSIVDGLFSVFVTLGKKYLQVYR